MRRYLGTLSALFALFALLISATTVGATGRGSFGGGGHAQGGATKAADSTISATTTATVTQSFKLTLYGTAPKGDAMIVRYSVKMTNGATSPLMTHVFCGTYRSSPKTYLAKPACKGGGTVYRMSTQLPKGSTIYYSFVRQRASDPVNGGTTWFKSSHKLNYNWLDYAWYRYGA